VVYSLVAFDTNHIKRFVFGTNRLKEIRGASSLLDWLNRKETGDLIKQMFPNAQVIYAYGGSALCLVDADQREAEKLGQAVQLLYHDRTGGGASISYAVVELPDAGGQDLLKAHDLSGGITMTDMRDLLRTRLNLAKDSPEPLPSSPAWGEPTAAVLARPAYVLLSPCDACGTGFATDIWSEPDEEEIVCCESCLSKRAEDRSIKDYLFLKCPERLPRETLWGRILQMLKQAGYQPYDAQGRVVRPRDFNALSDFTRGKDYLGLIYADGNGMGQAIQKLPTLEKIKEFAEMVDGAVFRAMADAIREHLPMQGGRLPFDVLMVGGDDLVLAVPAHQALQVARTLAGRFQERTNDTCSLSVGVVLAPVTYPFGLARQLAEETLKAAKTAGTRQRQSASESTNQHDPSFLNFVVVMGSTSLSYKRLYGQMHRTDEKRPGSIRSSNSSAGTGSKSLREEYFATLRPYALADFDTLIEQIKRGQQMQLGRSKLHQLREAILKYFNRGLAASVLDGLMVLHNFRKAEEREFLVELVKEHDKRRTRELKEKGTLFPWGLNSEKSTDQHLKFYTPLLDFIELFDFIS
jgi:hypothetical protein